VQSDTYTLDIRADFVLWQPTASCIKKEHHHCVISLTKVFTCTTHMVT